MLLLSFDWLLLIIRGWNVRCGPELEQHSLVLVKHCLQEVAQDSDVPNDEGHVHFFVQHVTSFREIQDLPRGCTVAPQKLTAPGKSAADHSCKDALGFVNEISLAFTKSLLHGSEKAL